MAFFTEGQVILQPVVCLRGGDRGICLGPPFSEAPLEVLLA